MNAAGTRDDPAGRPAAVRGVGVDLCSIPRMRTALERTPGLSRRLFRPAEREVLERARSVDGDGVGPLAAKVFAAKEAVMKSLGAGFDVVPFGSIEIDPEEPGVTLSDAASSYARARCVHLLELDLEVLDGPEGPVAVAQVVAFG